MIHTSLPDIRRPPSVFWPLEAVLAHVDRQNTSVNRTWAPALPNLVVLLGFLFQAGIDNPQKGITRWLWARIAAQVGEIDQAGSLDNILGDPLEVWAEIRASSASGFKSHLF